MKNHFERCAWVATYILSLALGPSGALGIWRKPSPGPTSSSCGWATFGQGIFDRTSVHEINERESRQISFQGYADPTEWLGMFIHPDYNFAFCPIQKNGCTAWTTTLNRMLTGNLSASYFWRVASESQKIYGGVDGIEKIFRNPNSTRAVFVRDPLVRFASAYLNKCVQDERGRLQGLCPLEDGEYRFSHVVEYFLERDMKIVNAHWALQASHCELYRRVKQFTVIGFMEKNRLASDATCLLQKAGLERFNAFNESEAGHQVNPSMGAASEIEVLKNLFTPESARAMINHLKLDYDTFGFDKNPAWIAEATGRWYNKLPKMLTDSSRPVKALSAESKVAYQFLEDEAAAPARRVSRHFDEDDLVSIAESFGFL